MSRIIQEVVEDFQNQHFWKDVDHSSNEEERELEEALSLCDLPISKVTSGNQEDEAEDEQEDQNNAGETSDNDFDFGSLIGSKSAFDGEMCTADEVFFGGQILPFRNSVSSMSGLRSVSRSDSMDRRGFASRSSSSRSSSVRSHYSAASSSGSSCCSNNTTFSTKSVPLVSKAKVQNQFHSYPSPKPQILGSGTRLPTYTPPIGKKSKMWEVLKLGLVRTPEIELRDLKLRQRTNNSGKTMTITRNNSTGSNSSRSNTKAGNINNIDRARKSCSNDGNNISNFLLEIQKRKNQLSETKIADDNNNSGFFKSCKCSVAAIIEPMPSSTRSNYGVKSGYNKFGNNQNKSISSTNHDVLNGDKNLGQKNKLQMIKEQNHQQQRKNKSNFRQGKQVTSYHDQHHHDHHRTFEWLRNLSHASVLNDS